jgi:multiple sugar transport system substrate-binding protein
VYDPNNPNNWDNLVAAGPTAVPTFAAAWQAQINTLVSTQLAALGT